MLARIRPLEQGVVVHVTEAQGAAFDEINGARIGARHAARLGQNLVEYGVDVLEGVELLNDLEDVPNDVERLSVLALHGNLHCFWGRLHLPYSRFVV
jgi:hypothetical protein